MRTFLYSLFFILASCTSLQIQTGFEQGANAAFDHLQRKHPGGVIKIALEKNTNRSYPYRTPLGIVEFNIFLLSGDSQDSLIAPYQINYQVAKDTFRNQVIKPLFLPKKHKNLKNQSGMKHIPSFIFGKPWAIDLQRAYTYLDVLDQRVEGRNHPQDYIDHNKEANQIQYAAIINGEKVRYNKYRKEFYDKESKVAIVPISGVLMKRGGMIGASSGSRDANDVVSDLELATEDSKIEAIVLHIDSPGGEVAGTMAIAETVKQINTQKPIVVFTDRYMASGGYWAGVNAAYIMVDAYENETDSLTLGSVGVYSLYQNIAKALEKEGIEWDIIRAETSPAKIEINPLEPLQKIQRAEIAQENTKIHQMFQEAVLAARPQIKKEMLDGRTFTGKEAIKSGLADGAGTMDDAVKLASKLAKQKQKEKKLANSNPQNNMKFPKLGNLFGTKKNVDAEKISFDDEANAQIVEDELTAKDTKIQELEGQLKQAKTDLESAQKQATELQATAKTKTDLEAKEKQLADDRTAFEKKKSDWNASAAAQPIQTKGNEVTGDKKQPVVLQPWEAAAKADLNIV